MKVKGKLRPLGDKVLVSDMEFGLQQTLSGLYVPGDDATGSGIHPRWGKVWAIGPDQKEVQVGDWILISHGRWTRTIEYENDDGSTIELRMVDNKAILVQSSEKPADMVHRVVQGHFNLNV